VNNSNIVLASHAYLHVFTIHTKRIYIHTCIHTYVHTVLASSMDNKNSSLRGFNLHSCSRAYFRSTSLRKPLEIRKQGHTLLLERTRLLLFYYGKREEKRKGERKIGMNMLITCYIRLHLTLCRMWIFQFHESLINNNRKEILPSFPDSLSSD